METLHASLTLGELAAPLKQKKHTISEEVPESNYADLRETTTAVCAGNRTNSAKTVKVTFTGEGNQLAVFKWKDTEEAKDSPSPDRSKSSEGEETEETEELSYTEMRLSSRRQPKDAGTPTADAESHYITTHEIQLTELDHDADCDFGRGSRWDYDNDNLVYSFVDYACFESVNAEGIPVNNSQRMDGPASRPPKLAATGALVSTESEPCESDKCTSSDESPCKTQEDRLCSTGQVHMAIKACPSVNSPAKVEKLRYRTARNSKVFMNSVRKDEALQEHGHCFIPAPGRQHLASKLRGKDVNEYSSGASSSVSELDDADKEVSNLTAKSFRSLACPYFDAINLRTSSESSVSEHGLSFNRWSAFVDWNYGRIGRECGALEATKHAEGNVVTSIPSSESTSKIELRGKFQSEREEVKDIVMTETSNVTCSKKTGLVREYTHKAIGSCATAITKPVRSGCGQETQSSEQDEGTEDTYKKAIFASSLLKNVISKKMQFEQECKMEREHMQHGSPCPPPQESQRESTGAKGLHRQISETGSVVSLEELGEMLDSVSHLSGEEQYPKNNPHAIVAEVSPESPSEGEESWKGPLPCSQNSAFKTWKDDVQEISNAHPGKDSELMETTASSSEHKEKEGANGKMTKMSHLYVPSSHLLPKERDATKRSGEKVRRENIGTSDRNQGGKAQEITIRLRSMKENKSNPFSIASLLTPNIGRSPVKSHMISVSDKVPHFMVRDVRDNKWKLHTPIHQVRDVRKLVKSSYRFVSLEDTEHKRRPSASHEESQAVKKEPDKAHFPSPMVIKCQSVNTSSGAQRDSNVSSESIQEPGTRREISQCPRNDSLRRAPRAKLPDPKLVRQKVEYKLTNQAALEKLKAAVKTMEQLYVFDRNEWKRKTEAPRVVTDSHVLSLITSKEHRLAGKSDSEDEWGKVRSPELNERTCMKPHLQMDTLTTKHNSNKSKCLLGPGSGLGSQTAVPAHQDRQCSTSGRSSSTKGPLCLKISPSKAKLKERGKTSSSETLAKPQPLHPGHSDSENYLTIPVKSCLIDPKLDPEPRPQQSHPPLQCSPVVTDSWSPESPTATMVYHHATTPQMLCITPPMDAPAPNFQRKLLLDPTTGQCYLVDTPVPLQPATQRLYYPECGRYMDVPLSVTPVPVSPVTLSPAYAAPACYVYPSTFLPPHSHVQSSTCLDGKSMRSSAGGLYLAPPTVAASVAKPVISITSQQGPQIIAPPSFDGTTMSFVVEHR